MTPTTSTSLSTKFLKVKFPSQSHPEALYLKVLKKALAREAPLNQCMVKNHKYSSKPLYPFSSNIKHGEF
ncbi:hypothetical protein EMIT0P201_12253 [Pseudomonas chlororaphis]